MCNGKYDVFCMTHDTLHPVPRKPSPSGWGGMANDPEGFFPEATAVRPWYGVHMTQRLARV